MSLPQIPIVSADQAVSDMLEALALQEAVASVIRAVAERQDASPACRHRHLEIARFLG